MSRSAAVAIALLAAAATPAAASGPGFIGGNLELGYATTFGQSYSVLTPGGSASFGFGNGLIGQIDGYMIRYSGGGSPYFHWAAHLGYQIDPSLAVGAFYGREWVCGSCSSDAIWGVGFVHSGGFGSLPGVRTEAFFARYGSSTNIVDLRGEFAIAPSIDLLAGASYGNWSPVYYSVFVGARYNFESGAHLRATLHQQIYPGGPQTQVALAFGYNFGQGPTFGRRGYHHIYPGW